MNPLLPRARKALASALSAALLISAPGPLAVKAAAIVINPAAARAATAGEAVAGVAAGSLVRPSFQTVAPVSAAAFRATPTAAVNFTVPVAAFRAPVAAPGLLARPAAVVPANAPVTALASGQDLTRRLEDSNRPGMDPKAGEALNAFYSGSNAAAACIFADMARGGKKPSDLRPGDAGAPTPANGPSVPTPRSTRFQVGRVHHAAMVAMAAIWSVWDRAMNSRWDKLPTVLGELYLYMNEQSLRLHIWDASAQPTLDAAQYPAAGAEQKSRRSADGTYFDDQNPGMAKAGARFNQLREPAGGPNPAFDKMDPNPLVVSEKLQQRELGTDGERVIHEAGILNDLSAGHIQFNLHDWANHERQPIAQDPVRFPIPAGHPLGADGSKEMTLDRTAKDPTAPASYAGPRTSRNMETSGWDMSQIYGSSLERQMEVRALKDGKMKIGADGRLLDDPKKPGVPLTGFNDNMSPQLVMMHTIWTLEHNSNADAIKAEHPDWNDEQIFQLARLRVSALNARLHTTEWTRALLPNRILQAGMWHDWYGFIGKRAKLWIMRFTDRHPRLGRVLFRLVRNELAFGVPGTATQHFGKHYGFVEEFPDVYRLHTMLRDVYKMQHLEAGPNGEVEVRLIKDVRLEDMIGYKSRDKMAEHSMQDWALTFLMESAGALTINNTPQALRALTTQDGRRIDLSAVDVIRIRERVEASTYVKFTMRLGEKPPRTFLELTGGNQEAADKLAAVYKSVDEVDFQIGILAERKPDAFALGNRQFKVFVLSAPARLKNDRFLSEQYDAATYGASGIEYVEHTNFAQILERHYPSLRAAVEGVKNSFAPLPKPGTLNDRLVDAATASSKDAVEKTLRNARVATAIALAAYALGFASMPALMALMAVPLAARILTMDLFPRAASETAAVLTESKAAPGASPLPLFAAEKRARLAASVAGKAALTVLAVGAYAAWHLYAAHPLGAVLIGAAALYSGLTARKSATRASEDLTAARVGLAAKLDAGRAFTDPATVRGNTDMEKRYWVMMNGREGEVLHFSDTYATLRASGLPAAKSFMTAAMWHVPFARKTWKNASPADKARMNPGFFDVWVPGLIEAQSPGNTRVFADGSKPGTARGDVDMEEFDRLFREFGMHDYLTAYDFARIREANQARDAREGRGTWLSRLIGRYAAKRRADQLLELFADRVVWEDGIEGRLVPAISRDALLRFYKGGAQYDLIRQRTGK